MSIQLKLLLPGDVDLLVETVRAGAKEIVIPAGFVDSVFGAVWYRAIQDGRGAVVGAWGKYGDLLGALGWMEDHDAYSGEPLFIEGFWYVVPKSRGHGVGRELLDWLEHHADEKGAHLVMPAPAARMQLGVRYTQRGYQFVEQWFLRRPKGAAS